ncbi:MAG: ArsC family transcriptional regulator [Gammaproteobacteria bacterium SG8_47]|nr:MAG: ArsC family transcriptional regulator [Gammaproteobacteria bacterium SG8_47]
MTTLYGIKNCDKIKAARRWLDQHAIEYRFHDYRDDGLDTRQVERWLGALGAEALVNRRSTTWRSLSAADQARLTGGSAAKLLCQHPTLVKRPLLEHGKHLVVGFSATDYASLLGT